MSFANHNILDIALSIIPPTVVQIRKALETTVDKYGQSQQTYGEWIEVYGIVQPGSEVNEHVEGIDISKKHVTIWLRGIALDGTHVQWAPDQIRYVGGIYNVVGVKDWYPYDDYRECDCVEALNIPESQRRILPSQRPQTWREEIRKKVEAARGETKPAEVEEQEKAEAPVSDNPQKGIVGKARIRF